MHLGEGAIQKPCFAQTNDPDILEMKRGGGCQAIFGLPFLFAGLFILQIPFGFIPVEIDEGPIILALVLPLGLVFAIAGAALMLGRNGITINRRDRIITQWWGLLVPMKKKEYLLDTFERVRLDFHPGDRDSDGVCTITLIGSGYAAPFFIPSPNNYDGAHQIAEQVSHFLEKPLEDLYPEEAEERNGCR